MMLEWDILMRMALAILLGGLIGVERVLTHHDAGLRTHILVCIGSAGIMVLSELLYRDYGFDIGRMGAQVVSGIGFLGAGCIIVNGNKIKGLTTAAGLWATACVGLIIGSGYYVVAVAMTLILLITLLALHPFSNWLIKKSSHDTGTIKVSLQKGEPINHIVESAYRIGLQITEMKQRRSSVTVVLKYSDVKDMEQFMEEINMQ